MISDPISLKNILRDVYYIDEILDFNGIKNIIYTRQHPAIFWFKAESDCVYMYMINTKEKRVFSAPMTLPAACAWSAYPDGSILITGGYYTMYRPTNNVNMLTDE
jgi:hypothetical protein